MTDNPQALAPCPWCGQVPDVSTDAAFVLTDGVKYGALQCCATGPGVRTDYKDVPHWRDKAIAAWNERATPAQGDELPPLPDYTIQFSSVFGSKGDRYWSEKRMREYGAVCRASAKQGDEPKWGAVHTVGDLVRNLMTLDQAAPLYTAFHLSIDGKRRCRTRGVTISRERVIDGKWIDSTRKDVPYAHVIWAKQGDEDVRDAALEEAARVVLDGNYWNGAPAEVYQTAVDRAEAIRKLKSGDAARASQPGGGNA